MNKKQPSSLFAMKADFKGRVENLALSPSLHNTLIPLFEAISNAIHSVQERFGEQGWEQKAKISISISQENGKRSFVIKDNGTGLNNENFNSFLTYDSRLKYRKGGKGVGRITWLKVFNRVSISSFYEDSNDIFERSFDFVSDNEKAIQNHNLNRLDKKGIKHTLMTQIKLQELKTEYEDFFPKKLDTIANHIASHFLSILMGDASPKITVEMDGKSIDLDALVREHTYKHEEKEFKINEKEGFTIRHMFLDNSLANSKSHTIYLTANERIVDGKDINNQIGINKAISLKDHSEKFWYVGIVSSSFLDENVTQERNNFDIDNATLEKIFKEAVDSAKIYLKEPISTVLKEKEKTIIEVVKEFPRYRYLANNPEKFAKDLPLNSKTKEDIYSQMSIHDFRESNKTKKELRSIIAKPLDDISDELKESLESLMKKIGEQEKSSLAEYMGKRKLIIDLLESRLGYEDRDKQKKYKEEAIHKIICPLRVNSSDIEYGDHNLWLIDDRLAYYDFWASDQEMRNYLKSSECKSRPDLVLFNGRTLMKRDNTNQPIVIVEFKRPALNEYDGKNNPITQVYNYIEEIKKGKAIGEKGEFISVGDNTPFFCYLVCDITENLLKILEQYQINQKLPGERGFFGFHPKFGAYIEVLQYSSLVDDAKKRHEAFFAKLNIN